jgi:hypothetical protein
MTAADDAAACRFGLASESPAASRSAIGGYHLFSPQDRTAWLLGIGRLAPLMRYREEEQRALAGETTRTQRPSGLAKCVPGAATKSAPENFLGQSTRASRRSVAGLVATA